MSFDLKTFEEKLAAAMEGENGHPMNMLLVMSQLIHSADVQALFKDKGIDVGVLQAMLKEELTQQRSKIIRQHEHLSESHEAHTFEIRQHHAHRSTNQQEGLHELVNAVKLRMIAEGKKEASAVDVFRQALQMPFAIPLDEHNPRRMFLSLATGVGGVEYAGVKSFEILDIKPLEFFPDLDAKGEKRSKEAISKMSERTAQFIGDAIKGLQQRYPGTTLEGMVSMIAGTSKQIDPNARGQQ